MFCHFSLVLVLLLQLNVSFGQDDKESNGDKPYFRILAPQYICQDKNKDAATSPPNIFTLRLQPVGGQRLKYVCDIRPTILNGPRGQWFNLNVWKSSRMLERQIKNQSDIITQSNIINVNNSLLTAGVYYTFNVSAVNEEGTPSDNRIFGVKFSDSKSLSFSKFSSENIEASILLIGAEITYSDQEYILEAQVTFCEPHYNYAFNWSVMEDDNPLSITFNSGKLLRVAANTFHAGRQYYILCQVINSTSAALITQDDLNLVVFPRQLSVELNFNNIVITTDQELTLVATPFYEERDELTYLWSCKTVPESLECTEFMSNDSFTITSTFSRAGMYEISVKVSSEMKYAENSCLVTVTDQLLPVIAITNFPNKYVEIPEGGSFKLEANVDDLKPGCELRWKMVQEDGFEYFDDKNIDGGLGNLTIYSLEDNFLHEISDYSNDTFNRDIELNIPEKSSSFSGLKGDVKYKTRLEVLCPCMPKLEICPDPPEDNIAYVDIVLKTNKAPEILNISVIPLVGEALRTTFKISTPSAVDKNTDYPLLYKFSYKTNNREIEIGQFYENYVVDTALPFSESSIIPVCAVCDARGACARKEGPEITVTLPLNITKSEFEFQTNSYQTMMEREDFADASRIIYNLLDTFKAMTDQTYYKETVDSVLKSIKSETIKLREKVNSKTVNADIIQNFVDSSKDLLSAMNENRDDVLQDLIDLHNEIIMAKQRIKRSFMGNERKKRSLTPEIIKTNLQLSVELIDHSNSAEIIKREEENIIKKIDTFMTSLCTRNENFRIETKIISFEVATINFQQKFNSFFVIPFEINSNSNISKSSVAMVHLGKNQMKLNKVCVGKAVIPDDYLTKGDLNEKRIGPVFKMQLYAGNTTSYHIIEYMSNVFSIMLRIPISDAIKLNSDEVFKCSIWENNFWSIDSCQNEQTVEIKSQFYLQCNCKKLGYFSLIIMKQDQSKTDIEIITLPPEVFKPTPADLDVITSTVKEPASTDTTTTTTIEAPQVENETESPVKITVQPSPASSANERDSRDILITPKNDDIMLEIKSGSNSTIISIIVVLLIILSGSVAYILFRKRRNLRRRFNNASSNPEIEPGTSLQNINPNRISFGQPKYRRFHDEHLMDGSKDILDRYNDQSQIETEINRSKHYSARTTASHELCHLPNSPTDNFI